VALNVPPQAAARLRSGELAVLPTDTVYGIACAAADVDACARLYALKARPLSQATAVMSGSVAGLTDALLPELEGCAAAACRSLLPGPLTLIVLNPARRFPHLCGDTPERIGVRVPALDAAVAALADEVGGILITSANERGGPDPATLEEVPRSLREAAGFEVDGGILGGVPSSVIDITGEEPRVLRAGPGLERALELLR
jgi:L-threonylcarbamoyladenylate synthase